MVIKSVNLETVAELRVHFLRMTRLKLRLQENQM